MFELTKIYQKKCTAIISSLMALCAVMGASVVSSQVAAQDYLPILQYHHVGTKTPFSTSVTPAQLQEHMDYLDTAGFVVVDLAAALKKIRSGEALPEKAVAITFDDAYLDIYTKGYPIIKAKGFPFTIFINTQPIEWKSKAFLTWEQMKEMQKHKVVFANHTISHPYMLRLEEGENDKQWMKRITNEVATVEKELLQELGYSPKMIAYPYGESNQQIRNKIKEMGLIGFGQQSGVVNIDSDFSDLPRFPASGGYAGLSGLKTKLASLPMPLVEVEHSGDYATDKPVSMMLTFKTGKYRLKDLACYVSGQDVANLEWLDDRRVKVIAKKEFNYGRGRINCTMPSMKNNQFYWFSNVWIRPKAEEGYIQLKK